MVVLRFIINIIRLLNILHVVLLFYRIIYRYNYYVYYSYNEIYIIKLFLNLDLTDSYQPNE